MLKIMLINPPMPVFIRVRSLPLGLLSIASYLKHYGHEVKLVECLAETNDVEASIKEFRPISDILRIINLTVFTFMTASRDISTMAPFAVKRGFSVRVREVTPSFTH